MYNVTHYHKVVVLDKNMARPFIEALLPLCTLSSMGVCCLLTHNSPFKLKTVKNQKTAAAILSTAADAVYPLML